jgi:formate dehydrogenase major subunit
MPFHFPDGDCNWLTNAALDQYARIPEYKVCACRIEKLSKSEAYTPDGTYITQKMVAQHRQAELAQQVRDLMPEA